jgi:tRNA(Ile)-lysidine synthase
MAGLDRPSIFFARWMDTRVEPAYDAVLEAATMRNDKHSPISVQDAKRLFADWKAAPAIVLAVSGGPDSVAMMWLAARWRRALKRGPHLVAVTIDHGLRTEAAREARDVKRLAKMLDLPHRTLRWSGAKPKTGVPAAARNARYRLLAKAARAAGATHVLTAHTQDDQAETLLMRMSRGSGIAGLAAMARQSQRDGVVLARPLLQVPKARLVATLKKAKIGFADDPTNRDSSFTRPRFRALMPALAAEGFDARNLARLAARLARANAALDILVDGAERYLALGQRDPDRAGFDAYAFAALAEEIRLRLLLRRIDRIGHEGPAELGKVEALLAALDRAVAATGPAKGRIGLKQTLAGALVSLVDGTIRIEPAPPRRRGAD